MGEAEVAYFAARALWLSLKLSLPVIVAAGAVGLLIGLLQALTQIQEQTLAFVFKLGAAVVALLLSARWSAHQLQGFAVQAFDQVGALR